MSTARIELSFFFRTYYLDVFEGGLEGMGEGINLVLAALEATKLGRQQQ
jgi:hypothetical protein